MTKGKKCNKQFKDLEFENADEAVNYLLEKLKD